LTNYYNKDLYKILNVNFDATADEIKLSYRKLVRIYHPDVAGKNADIAKFKEIQEAYEILTNENTRQKYDILRGFYKEKIRKDFEEEKNKKNKYDEYIKKAKKNANKAESFSKSINEALDNLFNGQKNQTKKQEPKQIINGENINIDLSISCFEAITGTNRKVNIVHTQPCPKCEGRTFINGAICNMCNGTGEVSLQKKINVKIPKGVTQGAKVRIKKEGNKGLNGGKDGDLYLIINIEKNPYYEIEGMNILCNLPITPFEAVFGADVPIKILNETITVKVPEMTSSGQKLRLTGLGLDNKSKTKKGDIIITVYIKLPKELSEKEKELYKQLKNISIDDIRKDMNNEK
jgi:DnaJ-class molecular chaperone